MDIEAIYKEETGQDASYTCQDEWNAGRTHSYYYDDYVDWLEEKVEKLLQVQTNIPFA